MRVIGLAIAAAYVLTIVVANWLIQRYGAVPVGFGLVAPAGVFAAGVAFTLRDAVHERFGPQWTIVLIGAGAAVSALISPQFAIASGVAFLVSELADLAVYTPLRDRDRIAALLLSNVVGFVLDSLLFLWLAFGSLAFLPGQLVGKAWMTAAAVAALIVWQGTRPLPSESYR